MTLKKYNRNNNLEEFLWDQTEVGFNGPSLIITHQHVNISLKQKKVEEKHFFQHSIKSNTVEYRNGSI